MHMRDVLLLGLCLLIGPARGDPSSAFNIIGAPDREAIIII
jgi:hypothetical protein